MSKAQGTGYVKLWRSIKDWQWYGDVPVRTLFMHILVEANWEAKTWKGQTIQPGQFITSTVSLAKDMATSRASIHRSLGKLQSTGEVNVQTNNHWTLVTVAGWDKWQGLTETSERPSRHKRTSSERPAGTTKEVEEEKNTRREYSASVDPVFVALWKAFDGYGSKAKAIEYWGRLTPEDRAAIMDKVADYCQSTPGCKYRKMLEGWINPVNRLWERPIVQREETAKPVHKLPEATGWITDKHKPAA